MFEMVPSAGTPRRPAVTLAQLSPPSRVTCTWPSLVPAQITPGSSGDSAIAKTTGAMVGPASSSVSPPVRRMSSGSAVVRSGLMTSHV